MCHQPVQVPIVTRTSMRLLYIEGDGYVHLQNIKELTMREDLVLSASNGD